MKRYVLAITETMWADVEAVCEEREETAAAMIRRCIMLGLRIEKMTADGGVLQLKQGDKLSEIIW